MKKYKEKKDDDGERDVFKRSEGQGAQIVRPAEQKNEPRKNYYDNKPDRRDFRDQRPKNEQKRDYRDEPDRDRRDYRDRKPAAETNRKEDSKPYNERRNDKQEPAHTNQGNKQRQQTNRANNGNQRASNANNGNRGNEPARHHNQQDNRFKKQSAQPSTISNSRESYYEPPKSKQQHHQENNQKRKYVEKQDKNELSETQSIKAHTDIGHDDGGSTYGDDTRSNYTEYRREDRDFQQRRKDDNRKRYQKEDSKKSNREDKPRETKKEWHRERRKEGNYQLQNLARRLEDRRQLSDSDSEEEGLVVPFQTDLDRANEGRILKTKNIDYALEPDEERVIKRAIKSYWSQRQKVSSISDIKVIQDYNYPIVYLEYSLDGKQPQVNNLVSFMKAMWQDDNDMQQVFRKLYNSTYEQLTLHEFRTLEQAINYRAKLLGKHYIGEYRNKRICRNMIAVAASIPNRTIQFCFIDVRLNEISFNSIFLEQCKDRFPQAYEMSQKKLNAMPAVAEEGIITKEQAVVADEEASSDDQRPVPTANNIEAERKELLHLFSESLDSFEDKIEEKDEMLEGIIDDYSRKAQAEKLSEEISELYTTLNDYKKAVLKFQAEYDAVEQQALDKPTKDWKVHMLYKQLRILRNQLGSELPIISRKRELFEKLDKNNLVILEGETGSGKSTQLPQMLCQYYKVFTDPKARPIVLTQPRKLATRTLAERIAFEMDEKLHGFVDYVSSAGKTNQLNPDCKILVKLDRLLLDEIEEDPLLEKYSCLVIDEAHERTISIDVIIGLIKNILSKRGNFKVIITSATLDSALFEKYFKTKTFKVSGRMYPVTIKHLPIKSKENFVDKIYECINKEIIPQGNIKNEYRGHILAFCTTVDEINQLCERFRNTLDPKQFVVCPLHGKLEPSEQKKAFEPTGSKFKLVFSTRIAETAITIDKVKVVIDLGYDRQMVYDQSKRISSFELKQISQSAAKQRAGRAGRTSAGYCFRLYEESEMKEMRLNKCPEIESTPLDIVVLRLKQLQINDIENFPYLSPPDAANLKQSLEAMQLIGCLDEKEQINEIGRTLVRIPIEPLLSRAIVDGLICEQIDRKLRITDKIIKIIAMVVNPNIFYSNDDKKQTVEKLRFKEFADEDGDFFSLLNVFEAFEKESRRKGVHNFCKECYLNKKTLFQAQELVKEICIIIRGVTLNLQKFGDYVAWMRRKIDKFRSDKDLVTSCLLSSFCQNICLYSGDTAIGYTHVKTETPVQIYGTSFLSLQGLAPRWIVCYEIVKTSKTFCKIGQAVNFKMLELSVQPQVFKKYKLDECEKFNPFYEIITKNPPTILLNVFHQLKSHKEWLHRYNQKYTGLLQNCECVYNQATHQLKIYFVRNKENSGLRDSLQQFITNYEEIFFNRYQYSFLGMNIAELRSGCDVAQLELYSNLYKIELKGVSKEIADYVRSYYERHCESIVYSDQLLTVSFSKAEDRTIFENWFSNIELGEDYKKRIKVTNVDDSRDKMKKVAKGILKLRFWASELRNTFRQNPKYGNRRGGDENRYLMLYPNPYSQYQQKNQKMNADQQQKAAKKLEEDLNYTVEKLEQYFQNQHISFSITQNKNALNVEVGDSRDVGDEFELDTKLNEAYDDNPTLIRHFKVIAFRRVDTNLSNKPLSHWEKQIKNLIPWAEGDLITVRGFNNDKVQRNATDIYTDLWAEVHTFDSRQAEKFIKKHSGKSGILGSEKMHATMMYKQNIARMKYGIFKVFKNKYENLKEFVLAGSPLLEITEKEWTSKDGVRYIYLDCIGPKRDMLLQPVEKLRSFVKKTIEKVDPNLSRVLNSYQNKKRISDSLFEEIEFRFNYRVYLSFNYRRQEIELYCADVEDEEKLLDTLRYEINKFKKVEHRLSYRGKNIYRVKQILDEHSRRVTFSISFAQRCVYLSGKTQDVEECANDINRIVNEHKVQCDICYNLLSVPIKLFDCGHEFCCNCLLDHVRSLNDDSSNFPLQCPSYERCGKYINVHDLKFLLDEDEFNMTCDNGIARLVDGRKYHGCLTMACKQIFDVERTKNDGGEFSCGVCNLDYCNLCRGSAHLPLSCKEARRENHQKEEQRHYRQRHEGQRHEGQRHEGQRHEEHQEGNKGKGKKCDKCESNIYKNGSSFKVTCRCGAKICWVCCKIFAHDQALGQHIIDKHNLKND